MNTVICYLTALAIQLAGMNLEHQANSASASCKDTLKLEPNTFLFEKWENHPTVCNNKPGNEDGQKKDS